jgi:hypothetical protein
MEFNQLFIRRFQELIQNFPVYIIPFDSAQFALPAVTIFHFRAQKLVLVDSVPWPWTNRWQLV